MRFTRQVGFTSLEPLGALRGQVSMGWHNGKFSETMQGAGDTVIVAPPGRSCRVARCRLTQRSSSRNRASFRSAGSGHSLAGDMRYRFSASTDFDPGWASTPNVRFVQRSRARSPVRAVSRDEP